MNEEKNGKMYLWYSVICLQYWVTAAYGSQLKFGRLKVANNDNAENTGSRRMRRFVAGDSKSAYCKNALDSEAEKKVKKYNYPLKNDRNMDLQLVYLGKNFETQVLVTTMSRNTLAGLFFGLQMSSNLYQSIDGGRTFQKIQNKIGSAVIRSSFGIMKSPLDHNWIILISHSSSGLIPSFGLINSSSVLFISKDAGMTFTSVTLPFKLRKREPLSFHPKKKDWIIALEEERTVFMRRKITKYGFAWISKDFGSTWKAMMKGYIASSVKWGLADGKEGDEIYLATQIRSSATSFFSMFTSSASLTLWRSSDGGRFFEEIVEHCYNFEVEGNFVFATVAFNVTNGQHATKRILHVSKDSGAHFRPVRVPEISPGRFYSILDMHKGMIFLHVDEERDTGKGTLYISDADGLVYTKSLENHFYTNSGFTDFMRIESMPGVYITHELVKDNTIRSLISFNRGISWQPIYIDKSKYCENTSGICTLHYHKEFSKTKYIDVQPPLSSTNAPGIIFMHGVAGDALTGTTNVWLSVNGGYNWTKVANNPHHYAIGDNGNLLVIIPRINNTGNTLKYSIDQGRCWHELKFSDDNQPMLINGLVTEPHAQERTFSLWGYSTDSPNNQKEWNVITVNFHDMFQKKCELQDFDVWSPHKLNGKNGCFLGQKLLYQKPKLTANCYLGSDFKPLLKKEKCHCSKDDLECDYGFERQTDGSCKENKSIKPIEVCQKGEKMKERFSKGYRRVPGDECESKQAIDDVVKFIDEQKKCEPSEIDAFGIIKEEKKLIKLKEEEKKDELARIKEHEKEDLENADKSVNNLSLDHHKKPHRRKGKTFFLFIGILICISAVVAAGWFGFKVIRNRRYTKPTYVMSDLQDEIGNDNQAFDSRPLNLRDYADESDVEDDVMLPV